MALSDLFEYWNRVKFKFTLDSDTNSVVPHVIVDSGGGSGGAGSALGIANTVWYDPAQPTVFYVRRETDVDGSFTISWENLDGTAASPTVANLRPFSPATQSVSSTDGAQATIGAKADATWDGAAAASGISIWRYIGIKIEAVRALLSGGLSDAGPAWTSVWGVAGVPFTSADQHSAVASVTDAPTAGQKLVIDDLILSTDTDMTVTFKEETSGTVIFGPWYLTAKGGAMQVTPRGKKKLATANKKLQVITSVAGNITVQASYHSEA